MKYLLLISIFSLSVFANSTNAEDTHRYFGGLSEVKADTPASVMLTASTLMTEEVFSAKDTKEVEVAVMKQKKERVENGQEVQDFAMESTGHLYGGVSEADLKF